MIVKRFKEMAIIVKRFKEINYSKAGLDFQKEASCQLAISISSSV